MLHFFLFSDRNDFSCQENVFSITKQFTLAARFFPCKKKFLREKFLWEEKSSWGRKKKFFP